MIEIPVLFWIGAVVLLVGLAMLIWGAISQGRVREDDDPWWIVFLDWLYDKSGPYGVVGFFLILVGGFLMLFAWSPSTVAAWIAAVIDRAAGDGGASPSPTSS